MGARRQNRSPQAVPTRPRRVGLWLQVEKGPPPIWGAQIRETGNGMTELRYMAPATLDEAIGAFAAAGSAARILAGGTDLLVQMRAGMLKPGLIVDIKKIAEMTAIEQTTDGGFRIGAAVSGMALAEHKSFGKVWPGVLEADQPDRLETSAGAGLRRRQSLQRLTGRRQRAGDGRGRRRRHRAGPERPPRHQGRGRAGRSRPHQSEARRNPRQLHVAAARRPDRAMRICA